MQWSGSKVGVALLLLGMGCVESAPTDSSISETGQELDVVEGVALDPAPAVLPRLTSEQYHRAIHDLFGSEVIPPSGLEPDSDQGGMISVGTAISSVSPLGAEQYAKGAAAVAEQVLATPESRAAFLPCVPSGTVDADCARQAIDAWGLRIWRRPLTGAEVDAHVAIATVSMETLGDFHQGLSYALSALLQSPHFLYRHMEGEAVEGDSGIRRYTSWEMASRLSFFLWNTIPDDLLLEAAASNALVTDEGLAEQVSRMMGDERSGGAVANFFSEWLHLYKLKGLTKDPTVFKHYSADLGESAREETLRGVEHLVFQEDADIRTLFTTRRTWVNKRLAAIYNIPAVTSEGFGEVMLPLEGQRAGFFGQVSFLGLHAHPVSSSPTLRGVFVREELLCQSVPSPPADTNTAIPEPSPDAITLKDRLQEHMTNPSCAGCHAFTDPIGFGLESFDGIGRYRILDNGGAIDPSGSLDEVEFADAIELMEGVANHPEFPACFVEKLYAYANSRGPTPGEAALLAQLTDTFITGGHRVLPLMEAIVMSPGFRQLQETTP